MSEGERGRSDDFEARHSAIIARTLRWADQAAERRDYARALHWVEMVRSLGQALPDAYAAKRRAWLRAVDRCETLSRRTAPYGDDQRSGDDAQSCERHGGLDPREVSGER